MVVLSGKEITAYSDERGNRIVGTPRWIDGSAKVEFNASNCVVTFGEDDAFRAAIGFHRDGSRFTIGDRTSLRGRTDLGLNCVVTLGQGIYAGQDLQMLAAEETSITLGDDLLISDRVRIRTDDSHPIYDGLTGERINHSKSVVIGDHVWIGQEVYILPGSAIASGVVVGARSVVTKSRPIPANSMAVGSPASVVRENIRWVRKHLRHDDDVPESIAPEPLAIELHDSRGRSSRLTTGAATRRMRSKRAEK